MGQDFSVIAETVTTTAPGGITVGSGGTLGLASGSLVLTSGSLKITGGNISLASGQNLTIATGATISNNAIVPGFDAVGAPGTASVSVATATGTTVPIAQGIVRVSGTAATTSGSCTLAAGTLDGQQVTIVNEGAVNFVVTGNMKANQTIAASSAANLVWVSADTLWWRTN